MTKNVNFEKLERDVVAAIEADERYSRENDAKFRAIEQRVGSYDEFREIVKASHLRPLDKGEKLEFARGSCWNPLVSSSQGGTMVKTPNQLEDDKEKERLPKDSHEFQKLWKRHFKSSSERFHYLVHLHHSANLAAIFKVEIPSSVLQEMLESLLEVANHHEQLADVLQLLESLSKTNRFQLNLTFMNGKEKQNCQKLFQILQQIHENSSDHVENHQQNGELLTQLTKLYDIK